MTQAEEKELNEVFDKVVEERAKSVVRYLKLLEEKGVNNNIEAQSQHALISDSDRHLKALVALGADAHKLPQPIN